MESNRHIDQLIDGAMESTNAVQRAAPAPYLFTRVRARMQRENESGWEKAVRFVARPAIAIVGLVMIIAVNAIVIAYNKPARNSNTDQLATTDEFSTSVATLYYVQNNEP